MANPVLSKTGVTSVTLSQANVYPSVSPKLLNQFVGLSDSNVVRVAKVGPPVETLLLSFEHLTREDKANLEAFFANPLVDYGLYTFQYTDHNGTTYDVQNLEPQFAIPEVANNNVKFDIVLTIV